jgi:hypothetical protein
MFAVQIAKAYRAEMTGVASTANTDDAVAFAEREPLVAHLDGECGATRSRRHLVAR